MTTTESLLQLFQKEPKEFKEKIRKDLFKRSLDSIEFVKKNIGSNILSFVDNNSKKKESN